MDLGFGIHKNRYSEILYWKRAYYHYIASRILQKLYKINQIFNGLLREGEYKFKIICHTVLSSA